MPIFYINMYLFLNLILCDYSHFYLAHGYILFILKIEITSKVKLKENIALF